MFSAHCPRKAISFYDNHTGSVRVVSLECRTYLLFCKIEAHLTTD